MIGSAAAGGPRQDRRRREAIVLVAALLATAATAGLGLWQLSRAAAKQAMQASLDSRSALPPLGNAELARAPAAAEAQLQRRVRLEGRWAEGRTVFLDNRPMDRRVGFVVVTPLVLAGSGEAVLVQRGWAPRRFDDRTVLPDVTTPAVPVVVDGILQAAPSRVYDLGGAASASGPIRQNLDVAAFARETGLGVLPSVVAEVETAANAGDGLRRRWPPPATGVDRHHGYAAQWFALAAAVVALYVWHRLIRPRLRRRADPVA